MRRILHSLLALAALVLLSSCQSSTLPPSDSTAAKQEVVPEKARHRALSAKAAMFQELSGKLMEAMAKGGPPAAIEVCSKEAPQVAERVGKRLKVRIGRTSLKLRNPKNAPPDWAKQLVEQQVGKPTFLQLPDGGTGALLPIRLEAKCLPCHGPPETVSDDVRKQLAKFYPEDRATGFKVGDLRGWFWVEVPAKATEASESQ